MASKKTRIGIDYEFIFINIFTPGTLYFRKNRKASFPTPSISVYRNSVLKRYIKYTDFQVVKVVFYNKNISSECYFGKNLSRIFVEQV